MDVLIILANTVTHQMRNEISDIAFEINFKHGTNISVTVFDAETWNSSMMKLTTFHSEVVRDGVAVYET